MAKSNGNTTWNAIRNLTGEYKKIEPECREGVRAKLEEIEMGIEEMIDVKGTGAGGAFITVKDSIVLWTNLLEGNLISKSLVSDMLSKQSGDGVDAEEGYYDYGMWIMDNPGAKDFARVSPYYKNAH